MKQPPERLSDRALTGDPVKDLASDLARTLRTPPRMDPERSARLDRSIARIGDGPRRARWWGTTVVPAVALLAMVVAVPALRHHRSGVQARGPEHRSRASAATPALLIFRIRPSAQSEPLGDAIGRGDELAFAYRTDGSDRRVMVFARDERGRIYWYHPAWTDAAQNPEAVPLARQAGVHELPAAVTQSIEGGKIEICGLFTTRNLRVREAEAELARGTLQPACRKVAVSP